MLQQILHQRMVSVIKVLVSSVLSGLLGIGILAFMNQYLLHSEAAFAASLLFFIALTAVYFVVSTYAQMALTSLGHQFVKELRIRLMKQVIDSDWTTLKSVTKSRLMASVFHDVQYISYAFVRMPELFQGGLFVVMTCLYMYTLSPEIFWVVLSWIILTLIGGNWSIIKVYRHMIVLREAENQIVKQYESVYDGFKELALNRHRAKALFSEFEDVAEDYRRHIVAADNFHAFAGNFTNVMMLGAVGMIFYLSVYQQWADMEVAITLAVALLFMRTPLISAVGAFPTLIQARVSLKAIASMKLEPYTEKFALPAPISKHWRQIQLQQVAYRYDSGDGFSLKPMDMTIQRGEVVFLVGENGSGKSTLSMLLAGLYIPSSGDIYVDDIRIDAHNRTAYRQMFSSVFTDFYLFAQLMNAQGQPASEKLTQQWLHLLEMDKKTRIENYRLINTALSQGQRKRLGLLVAAVEEKPVLILDEWAADQDPTFRKFFYRELLPLLRQQGHTIVAISHDDKYFHHADRILEMRNGQLRVSHQGKPA